MPSDKGVKSRQEEAQKTCGKQPDHLLNGQYDQANRLYKGHS
jgi:hypothetical protein